MDNKIKLNDMEKIKNEIKESIQVKSAILNDQNLLIKIDEVCKIVVDTYNKGNKTIFAGNGGSAADSQHLAAEFVSRFYFDRPGLNSLALTTDTSILTAVGNDYGYENLFSRQIEAVANKGDVYFAISTSGNSPNIIKSIKAAKNKGVITVGLTGNKKNKMSDLCDITISVPSASTPRIQESHILIGHIICGIVEEIIFYEYK
jgi:D-sedoheptulose 7-phosphate isomerase